MHGETFHASEDLRSPQPLPVILRVLAREEAVAVNPHVEDSGPLGVQRERMEVPTVKPARVAGPAHTPVAADQ